MAESKFSVAGGQGDPKRIISSLLHVSARCGPALCQNEVQRGGNVLSGRSVTSQHGALIANSLRVLC